MSNFDLPWYDPNPRRVLARFNQETKEENMNYSKDVSDIIQSSPIALAFAISTAADNHLKLFMDASSKFGIDITREKTKKLNAELLSLHYFLITIFLNKYISGNQFTFFVLRTHVALLDILPKNGIGNWLLSFNPFSKSRRDNELEISLLEAFRKSEKFYIHNELDKKDKQELTSDLTLFEIKEDVYKNNIITQFLIKSSYHISDILSVRENPARFIPLCVANRSIIETSFEVAQKIRPVWHLPEDEKVIGDFNMQDQMQ